MKRGLLLIAILCAGCSANSPTGPSVITTTTTSVPAPSTWTFSAPIVSTLTNQNLGTFTSSGSGVRPSQRVSIEQAGYVTRQTTISASSSPTLDLFPSSLLDFYRQMARNGYERGNEPIRHWTQPPGVYISQDGSLSPEDIRRMTEGILAATNQITPFGNVGVTIGPSRPDQAGWITIGVITDTSSDGCGFSNVGVNPGHITLNFKPICSTFCPGAKVIPGTVAHEMGHALGFWHVPDGLMKAGVVSSRCADAIQFTAAERQAAQIAYARPNGNRDPDVDPDGLSFVLPERRMID